MKYGSLLFLISVSISLYGCGDRKYKVYSCPSKQESESCSDKCTSTNKFDLKYSFVSDKNSKSVLMIAFINDVQQGSVLNENCTILSENNWDCSKNYLEQTSTYKMANGIFSSYQEWKIEKPSTPNHSVCAR